VTTAIAARSGVASAIAGDTALEGARVSTALTMVVVTTPRT